MALWPTAKCSYGSQQRWSPRGRPWPRGHILKSLASRPQVLENWPVLESRTALFFELLKILWSAWKNFWKTFFCGDRLKNLCEDLSLFFFFFFFLRSPEKFLWRPFFFFFWRALALVSLVLGLEHSCPWPRECLSSERLSLTLASDFFCVLGLGLEPCVLDSTSGSQVENHCPTKSALADLKAKTFFSGLGNKKYQCGLGDLLFVTVNIFVFAPWNVFILIAFGYGCRSVSPSIFYSLSARYNGTSNKNLGLKDVTGD